MLCKGRKRGRGMTREEAEKYAENMTYREAIHNLKHAKSVPYRKATFIKVNELLDELEPRWIPVSEKLPEENGGYLVTVKRGYVTTALWVGNAENWKEVTAWMPLPEPYKAESEKT